QGAFIYNNVLYDNHATGIALFQQDGGGPSVNAQIVHNTIVQAVDGRWCILLVDGASGAQVYNNILFNLHPWRGSLAADPDATPGLMSDYNLVVDSFSDMGDGVSIPLSDWQALGYDPNSALADPLALLFVDPAAGDFHLIPGSQAVDNGNSALALGVTTDIEGHIRPTGSEHDNGAYEEQSVVLAIASAKDTTMPTVSQIERFVVSGAKDRVILRGPLAGRRVQIVSLEGRQVAMGTAHQDHYTWHSEGIPSGLYVILVWEGQQVLFVRAVIRI
ncbi:MAG: choice-of-anchor Q domain-containing protein, partial [Saprospiraceae bacterium]|nr:choice-of-anchor Q domain-containing protein [Saprospiraceae bacterium]